MNKVTFMLIVFLFFGLPTGISAKEIYMKVEGMTCNKCPVKVESALKNVKGVKSCEVSMNQERVVIQAENDVKEETLVRAVDKAGHFKARVIKEKDLLQC